MPDTTKPLATDIIVTHVPQVPDTVAITFTDDVAVDVTSILANNVIITDPQGSQSLGDSFTTDPLTNAASIAALYQFQIADTLPGLYSISLLPNNVADTSGNFVDGQVLGTFTLPAPTVTVNSIGQVPGTSVTVVVTYASTEGIDYTYLGNTAILLTGPNGYSQTIPFDSSIPNDSGVSLAVTYILNSNLPTDVGLYTISLIAHKVPDLNGNFIPAQTLGTFVFIPAGITYIGPYAVTDGFVGPYAVTANAVGPYRVTLDHAGPYLISNDFVGPYAVVYS